MTFVRRVAMALSPLLTALLHACLHATKTLEPEHKYIQKGDLQRHIKSVHEGQTFQCPLCEYKATWKRNLKKHIDSVHEGHKNSHTKDT